MRTLALDCCSRFLSVAVLGGEIGSYAELELSQRHAERLMAVVDFCMAQSGLARKDLELIACGSGPGSFTGLRIAYATAKGIAEGLGLPLVGVPSLDAMAYGLDTAGMPVLALIDARKARFYAALYEGGGRKTDYLDAPLERILALVDTYPRVLFTGPDADCLEGLCQERSGFVVDPLHRRGIAKAVAALAEERFREKGPDPHDAGPLYLRGVDIGGPGTV